MSEELYNSSDYCSLAEQYEELKKENAELARDKDYLMNLFMESSEYVFNVVANMKIESLTQKCKVLEADYEVSNREMLIIQVEIGRLKSELARRDEELLESNNDKKVFLGDAKGGRIVDKHISLRPCPFCGNKNPRIVHHFVNGIANLSHCFVRCNCGRGKTTASRKEEHGAIDEWNTRPIEDELRAELEKRTAGLHDANAACMEMKHELDRLNAEIKTTDDLRAEIAQGNVEIALLDKELADLRQAMHALKNKNAELSRFVWWVYQVYARNVQELTSGITEACTYETEEKAEKGKYGLPIRCWEYIRYLEEYTAGIYNGTYLDSETSTVVKRDLSDFEINELGAQEAEKRGEK